MNRQQYEHARRLFRNTGRYALRWVPEYAGIADMQRDEIDWLVERQKMATYCQIKGYACNARFTCNPKYLRESEFGRLIHD